MTMFDWNASSGESVTSTYLWIYFVAAVPLTFAVIGTWWVCYRRRRKRLHRELLERAIVPGVEEIELNEQVSYGASASRNLAGGFPVEEVETNDEK